MRNILIYKKIEIKKGTDYKDLHNSVRLWHGGSCPNFGNKLWYQSLISLISTPENNVTIYDEKMSPQEINEKFDLIIYPMANIFSTAFYKGLPKLTEIIKQFKIPVFVISCGVQADNYDQLDEVCEQIGNESKEFISAVYNTGGQFALRGYFTAEFFKKLGFNDPAVVGCPSLYQLGNATRIDKKNVEIADFKPSFNGSLAKLNPYMKLYKNSIFYDQDVFYDILYNPNFFNKNESVGYNVKKILKYNKGGVQLAELLHNDRLRLIADMWDWQDSFIHEGISFSFGSRIHGSVIALLSGVPAVVVGFDSRTREMAEFYDIPCVPSFEDVKPEELYSFYEKLDYTKFNNNLAKKISNFEEFLRKCGIVDNNLNFDNKFLNRPNGDYPKTCEYINKDIKQYTKKVMNNKLFYNAYLGAFDTYRKIFKH